jgi:hypothetical protein|tara:strand:- start:1664 stop:1891 length:228 start_codon:yes stop_codon:yes gene_type:complete
MATIKSMRGKEIDMEKLNLKNETLPAVGNMKVNARGDEIGKGGKVVRTREAILKDYYDKNPRAIQEEVVDRSKKS